MNRSIAALALPALLALLPSAANGADEPMRPRGTGSLLVRVEGKLASEGRLREQTTVAGYQLRPLFRSPPFAAREGERATWFVAEAPKALARDSGWAEAYAFVRAAREAKGHPAFSSVSSIYAEPDQEQEWKRESAAPKGWPQPGEFAWHLGDRYTQLAKARKSAARSCEPRITILDTGIDPVHVTLPRRIDIKLGWNYVEDNDKLADPGVSGGLNNPGHGTATIALLAGNRIKHDKFDDDLGGAPDAIVVPVRISTSVIHFWTRTMAQGIDHAANLPRIGGKDYCDVVSVSMGGVASRAWADAVNSAYEKGVLIVAAAGNNFHDLPTRYTVYPSRFARVTTAVGITAADKPYRASENGADAWDMQGNFGPASMEWKTIAAYTPKMPWARLKDANGQYSKDGIEMDGAGTSCATPQVAAAASLWLGANGAKFAPGWKRVEAARWALLESAKTPPPKYAEELGRGTLRAFDALSKVPGEGQLKEANPAEVSFPFLRILLGWDEPDKAKEPGIARMYEVEAFNLAMIDPKLSPLTGLSPQDASQYKDRRFEIVKRLAAQPDISPDLRKKLLETR
jgi:subtilisin family serine protease